MVLDTRQELLLKTQQLQLLLLLLYYIHLLLVLSEYLFLLLGLVSLVQQDVMPLVIAD